MTFAQLYNDLYKYIDDPRRRYCSILLDRFKTCVRAKRGLEDTAQRGGLYKDKVYFEGAVKILQKRKQVDVRLLYAGKLSIDDIQRPELMSRVNAAELKYPYFARDSDLYSRALDRIAAANFID